MANSALETEASPKRRTLTSLDEAMAPELPVASSAADAEEEVEEEEEDEVETKSRGDRSRLPSARTSDVKEQSEGKTLAVLIPNTLI